MRFQCVAKNWYHLFKNPTFVSQHHSLSKKNRGNSLCLVVHHRALGNNCVFKSIGMLSFADAKTLVSYHDLHQPLPFNLADIKPLSVSDGLVCLYNCKDHSLTLWNPARKEFRVLPRGDQYIPSHVTSMHPPGCGTDPLSNDYKVLYFCRGIRKQYAIYRMSSNSLRVLEEDVEIVENVASFAFNRSNACVNGVCYWLVLPSISERLKVLTFHLNTEVFKFLRSPIPGTTMAGQLIPLHDDRVAYWEHSAVWVLNDEENWTKLFNIYPLPVVGSTYDLFGFWTHGKVFEEFGLGYEQDTFLYDLQTRKLDKPGFEGYRAWFYPYQESLIAVRPE